LFTDAELSYAVPGSTANLVVDLNSADKAARIGAFRHLFGKLGDGDEGLVELAKENVVRRLLIEDEDEVLLTILEWDGLVGLFGDDLDGIEEGLRKVMDKDGKKVREAGYKALVEVGVAKMAGLEGSGLAILGELLVSKKVGLRLLCGLLSLANWLVSFSEPKRGRRLWPSRRRRCFQIPEMGRLGPHQRAQTAH
jgi:hypothetical protein